MEQNQKMPLFWNVHGTTAMMTKTSLTSNWNWTSFAAYAMDMHPCGTIFFSLFRLMFRIYSDFVFFFRFFAQQLYECVNVSSVYSMSWMFFISVEIQKRPSHRYIMLQQKTQRTVVKRLIVNVWNSVWKLSIQYAFMANCWFAWNRITINDHVKCIAFAFSRNSMSLAFAGKLLEHSFK